METASEISERRKVIFPGKGWGEWKRPAGLLKKSFKNSEGRQGAGMKSVYKSV
jgi:hypothetical protein